MERLIDLPPVLCGAELRAQSFEEASNTIEVRWTTGAIVRRQSWMDGPYDEELVVEPSAVRLGRLNSGAPFLDTHSSYSLSDILGSVVPGSARLENGAGIARIQLSTAPGAADAVHKIKEGVIRNVSVGYIRHVIEKTESDTGAVPLWRVIDWEPYEISPVPVPADPGAQIRSASTNEKFRCLARDGSPSSAVLRARMAMRALNAGYR